MYKDAENLKEKIDYYFLVNKVVCHILALVIIIFLTPVILEAISKFGSISEDKRFFETVFEQSPYLKYFFYMSMTALIGQALSLAHLIIKVNKLNSDFYKRKK